MIKEIAMRVAIGIPSGDMVHADFACSLASMMAYTNKADVDLAIINHKGPLIATNRNRIVHEARKLNADYLFFVDTDMTFPPDTLLHMIAAGKPIVACDAVRKRTPHDTIAMRHGKHLGKTNRLVEVDSIGTGIMLIHMSVFKDMPKPYFVTTEIASEDVQFCRRAKLLGFLTYCQGKLSQQIGHLGTKEFMIGD